MAEGSLIAMVDIFINIKKNKTDMAKQLTFGDMLSMQMEILGDWIPSYSSSIHGKTQREVLQAQLENIQGQLAALDTLGDEADKGYEDFMLKVELFRKPSKKNDKE